ncbi:NADPH-dependent FMN reductase [Ornithinimicrobium sp. Y1847]|uniref:NADPH-dependent FMN reductase n=1 Tax=Ornithinimicrobium sp. Y1847 TaxID=3405419 RepID=UPI003B681A20
MQIGIILGSVRDGRVGEEVAQWVAQRAEGRAATYELIDLKSFNLPVLTWETVPGAAKKQYEHDPVKEWSRAIDACDGYIFVTPEYNHSVPGAFKNAVDWLGPEWNAKTVGLVSYGAESGVRAVEHWRQIMANFSMMVVRPQVSMSTFLEWEDDAFSPNERRPKELDNLFEAVEKSIGQQLL